MINISVESGPQGIVISITGISGWSTANPETVKQSYSVEGAGSSSRATGHHNPDTTVASTSSGAIVIGPIVIPSSSGKSSGKAGDHLEPTGPGSTVIGPIVIPAPPGKPPAKSGDHIEPTGPGVP
jgi:hypothetical protein